MDKCKSKFKVDYNKFPKEPVLPKQNEYTKERKEFEKLLKEDERSFEDLYLGTWESDVSNPCQGCSNQGKVCHCTLGQKVIY